MKKLLLALALTVLIVPATKAQFTKIGAAAGYNYNWHFNNEQISSHLLTKYPSISVNAIYEINLPFHLVPRFTFYIPNTEKLLIDNYTEKQTISGMALDIDGHYVFNSLDKMELYGLAGVNILFARNKYKNIDEQTGDVLYEDGSNNTALGLNIGIGGYLKVKDEFDLFFELKGIISSQIQVVGTFGILMNMEYLWNKEKDSGY